MKSCKFKIFPNYRQRLILNTLSNEHRLVYNKCLEQAKSDISFKKINEVYKNFRNENSLTISSKSAQNTSISLINSIKSFLALKKTDPTAKYPYRFKSYTYFTTFMHDYNSGNGGFKIHEGKLVLNLINKYTLEFDLPNYALPVTHENVKTVRFMKEDDGHYYICFTYTEDKKTVEFADHFISIDLGISQILTAYDSQGKHFSVNNTRFFKLEKAVEKLQSIMDLKTKNSRKWKKIYFKFKALRKKLTNKNKDYQHKLSKAIVDHCLRTKTKTLIVGDIKTKKIKSKSSSLNKSTQNRGTLSRFKGFLKYKAHFNDLEFKLVNEAYTSQTNCLTGKRGLSNHLSIREHELEPGLTVDRDLNSAINIAKQYRERWSSHVQDFNKYNLINLDRKYMNCSSELCTINSDKTSLANLVLTSID